MKNMKTHFPFLALDNLLRYANDSLPFPKDGIDQMVRILEVLSEAFLSEVRTAVEILPPDQIREYGFLLNKRMFSFNCFVCEVSYDVKDDRYKIAHLYPVLDILLLNDPNPDLMAFKHKLCYQAVNLQNRMLEYLDKEVWELHPCLHEGAYPEDQEE